MTADDERLDQIKHWWKQYRWTILTGAGLGILAVGGWTGWSEYTRVELEEASVVFQELSAAVVEADASAAQEAFDQLQSEHSTSTYADNARLLQARAVYEQGDAAGAKELLRDAAMKSSRSSTSHTARLRLARLYIADTEYQQALDLLGSNTAKGYESYYQELKGDAFRGLNEFEKAQDAYRASIDALDSESASYETILTLKLNDSLVGE